MNIKLILSIAAILFLSTASFAQENQIVIAERFGDGIVTSYTMTGCCSERFNLTFSDFDGKKMFKFKKEESTLNASEFYVDEEAFPVTFIKASVRGNKEQQERLKVLRFYNEERIVFLGEWVYELTNWKGKDDYHIAGIYLAGDIRGFKAVKAALGAKKKMTEANHKVVLQNYLDEAFAKQAKVLAVWNVENASKIEERKRNEEILNEEINQKNADYWASEEGQAIQRRNNKDKPESWVTLKNTTSQRVYVINGLGSVSWIASGGESRFFCSNDMYYALEDASGNISVRGTLISNGDENCGEIIELK